MSQNVELPGAVLGSATGTPASDRLRDLLRALNEKYRNLQADLKNESDRLARRVLDLEKDLANAAALLASPAQVQTPASSSMERRVVELEQENRDFAQRCVQLEEHNANLANLYAATYQLHARLDPAAVVQCVVEIAVNLIGASEFSLLLLDESKGNFLLAVREGESPPELSNLPEPVYPLEQAAVKERRTLFAVEQQEGPICCTPLHHEEKVVGYVSIYALLTHKPAFTPLDHELLDLLSAQAALAIVSSQAHVSVDRKLKTVQRFIEILKSQ